MSERDRSGRRRATTFFLQEPRFRWGGLRPSNPFCPRRTRARSRSPWPPAHGRPAGRWVTPRPSNRALSRRSCRVAIRAPSRRPCRAEGSTLRASESAGSTAGPAPRGGRRGLPYRSSPAVRRDRCSQHATSSPLQETPSLAPLPRTRRRDSRRWWTLRGRSQPDEPSGLWQPVWPICRSWLCRRRVRAA